MSRFSRLDCVLKSSVVVIHDGVSVEISPEHCFRRFSFGRFWFELFHWLLLLLVEMGECLIELVHHIVGKS